MSEEFIQRVLTTIAASKRIPPETVLMDSEFQALGIDSMDAVEILFALENEFDINIPDEEVRNVKNVRDMVEGVARLVAAKEAKAATAAPNDASNTPAPETKATDTKAAE